MYVQVSLLHPGPLFRHCDSDRRFLHLVDGVQVQGGVIDGFCTVLHCTVLYCAVLRPPVHHLVGVPVDDVVVAGRHRQQPAARWVQGPGVY